MNVIQHEQYHLTMLLTGLKAEKLLKRRLCHRCFPKSFVKLSFFIEHIWAAAFGLSFVNPRKKSVK